MKSWLGVLVVGGAALLGCGADLGDCPPDSDAQQAAGKVVMEQQCNNCHASGLSGSQRQGAPDEYNFDDPAVVSDEAEEMYGEAEEGEMPPGGALSSTDLEAFRVYLACGAKAP